MEWPIGAETVEPVIVLPLKLSETIKKIERKCIEKALAWTEGNKKEAAELLGLKRTTLVMKMKASGMLMHEHS
jgi:DNA-binding NtrC family response regulator